MTAQPIENPHVRGAVLRVSDLDRAVEFYSSLFELHISNRESDAAMLAGPDDQFEIVLVERGTSHYVGSIGVQALVWQMSTIEALNEHERRLEAMNQRVKRNDYTGLAIVTTHDPDGTRLLLVSPTTSGKLDKLPLEVFAD